MARVAGAALWLAAWCSPLVAQERSGAGGSPLVIETSFDDVASELVDGSLFQADADLPGLRPGERYVLSLDDGGSMHVEVARGEAGLIAIRARPARLMDLHGDRIARARQMVQGIAVMALGQQGMRASEAIRSVRAVFDLPLQIDRLEVRVAGDPGRPEQGYRATATVAPVSDTWLDRFVRALRPSAAGAPVLDDAGALMSLSAAVEVEPREVVDPFLGFLAAMGSKTRADTERHRAFAQTAFACSTGNVGMAWNPGAGGMRVLVELRDAERLAALQRDPDYQKWLAAQARGGAGVEVEFEAEALEHRGVVVSRTTMAVDTPVPHPLFGDGQMRNHAGIAGRYSIATVFDSGEDAITGLIDAALDGQIEHAPLAGDRTLSTFRMRLAELADVMSQGMAPVDQIPETVRLAVRRADAGLVLEIEID